MMADEIQKRLALVQQRVLSAADKAQRDAKEITLIAVSKTYPADAIRALAAQKQYHFGENYIQEWLDKVDALKELPLCWHVIGSVQANKTQHVARHAHWLHTLDRIKIARRLSAQRPEDCAPLNVCLQVNISAELSKSGVLPQEVLALAKDINVLPNLCLKGLMCLPEQTDDASLLATQFSKMQQLSDSLQQAGLPVCALSMGMSADLELAIAHGATHIRVGSAIFGVRRNR